MFHWRFRPRWQNSGETPTKRMTLYTGCELRDTLLPMGEVLRDRHQFGSGLLAPKTTMTGGVAPALPDPAITPQDIVEVQAGRKFLYLWGWAKYFDVFPNTPERITRFCWAIFPTGDPFNPGPLVDGKLQGISFPYVHYFYGNCADDECGQYGE
jgi:hypothetical protein